MEFSIDLVAALIGMGADELKRQFVTKDENGEKTLEGDALAEKVKELAKQHEANILEAGRRNGARDRMTDFEQSLRTKYGVNVKAEREALVEAILAAKTAEQAQELERLRSEVNAKKAAKLEDLPIEEQKKFIAQHPFFSEQTAQLKAEAEQRAQELEQFKAQVQQREISGKLRARALEFLHNEYRAVLPDDAEIAKTITSAWLESLEKAAVWKVEGDDILPFNKEGERVLDNYKPVDTPQFFAINAKNWFKQHPADPNKGTPNGGGSSAPNGINIPDWRKMSKDEIFQTVLNEKDPVKAAALEKSAAEFLG